MNTEGILNKLRDNGMCTAIGYPIGITRLLQELPEDIIKYGNQVLRGLLTQQRGCCNFFEGWRIQYVVQFSIAKTLASNSNNSTDDNLFGIWRAVCGESRLYGSGRGGLLC
ncbi:group II intron reverse transcriptase/maturase [Sporomusa ovata]|uniref:group II intron reverse transcriptase/maturase n=1 Tax=Sporomusa ovata TaxID=2378 RepID=UPI0008FC0180|nr:group II intron reverse transcriptase/maturase [Sporomusa ovata]